MSDACNRPQPNKAVEYFDTHADYYEQSQYRTARRTFVNARHDRILALLSSMVFDRRAKILDAGCGPGNLLAAFAQRCGQVYAMDTSERMLRLAQRKTERWPNIRFQLGSVDALPFAAGSMDVVCSAGVIEYLESYEPALQEMHRVLRPGGLLIVSTTNVLAPANWLRPVLQPIARIPRVARAFGIQPPTFRLTYARIPAFKRRLDANGFVVDQDRHFYLTIPRPLDRVFPGAARRVEAFFDRHMNGAVKYLAEGYIAVARKSR